MAHYATKRFNYWSQLGILAGLCGGGLILGGIGGLIPFMGQVDVFGKNGGNTKEIMNQISKLANGTALMRWSQVIATPFVFFLPALLYARICHVDPVKHVGFNKSVDLKQVLIVILIMLACMPVVSILQQLTEMLPWSKLMQLRFKAAEDEYNQQVAIMARMNNSTDYLITLLIIAVMPAIFEEITFRGVWQNLLSRWFKMPVLAVLVMSALFSAIHGSYLGFLSRFALGFVLGWMYYRTGNIWLNIIGHFFNNAIGVTSLYLASKPGQKIDPSVMEGQLPLWTGLIGIAATVGLFIVFEKVSKQQIDRPGEEVLIPGYNFSNNPFINDIAAQQQGSQQ